MVQTDLSRHDRRGVLMTCAKVRFFLQSKAKVQIFLRKLPQTPFLLGRHGTACSLLGRDAAKDNPCHVLWRNVRTGAERPPHATRTQSDSLAGGSNVGRNKKWREKTENVMLFIGVRGIYFIISSSIDFISI